MSASVKHDVRVLVVDDDPVTRSLLLAYLTEEGYKTQEAKDAEQARELLRRYSDIRLVLLDIRLPGDDGLTLTRELRANSEIGIMLITGSRKDELDRIVGLELGADEYLTKPVNPREVLARAKNLLRRVARESSGDERQLENIAFGEWHLDVDQRRLVDGQGRREHLTEGEFRVLAMMLRRAGKLVTREQILSAQYQRDWQPADRTVDVLVGRLRRKLRDDPADPSYIQTVRGAGYRLGVELRALKSQDN